MPRLNENYLNIKESYLFAEISRRVSKYEEENPDKKVIRLGIGDVTKPLSKNVVKALKEGAEDQGSAESFHGYGPEQGYPFLRDRVSEYYAAFGAQVDSDEIFISDGAKSDTGNITELFDADNVILVPDPVYPVYVDTNIMSGKTIKYMSGNAENGFLPMPDDSVHADVIYLCSPNNPTGAVYNKEQLKVWVDYALKNDAVILFDAAYEAFITDPELPRSIFLIEGARKCAIEFCSFSKTAGFTGTRCGYTVVPKELCFKATNGTEMSLHAMWFRRQSTKFNGTSYVVQRGAAEVFTEAGMAECRENIAYYQENARTIAETLDKHNIRYFGGTHSPYIWFECPNGMDSWGFFDKLLNEVQVVGTPGAGFGDNGKNFFRLTSFGSHEATKEAMERIEKIL
ncbi:MAG: LL-diaminopimelate aminotransferase [Eubacterium sp.]|nr:LL-diaminopimelate aminotransferase [Eubacterium sp.]